jgi:outer membrane protein OmpA-like peptidoglycan-associated protein
MSLHLQKRNLPHHAISKFKSIKPRLPMKKLLTLFTILSIGLAVNSQTINKDLFDPLSVRMSEVKINTVKSDFGPAVIGNFIYFTSFRDELMNKPEKDVKESEFYDLYRATINDSGNVTTTREPVEEFITRFHDGPVSWCAKTGELFITQSNYVDPDVVYKPFRNEDIKLRIVIAKENTGVWDVQEEFPYNNPKYSVGHPAINESGDTLIFASDMPGGFGSTDLYCSVRKNNQWSEPKNMGPQINTNGKEEFPFITGKSYDGRFLIFASTGHLSSGGFDLFYKNLHSPESEIGHFQSPINSLADDFGMTLPENVEYGYMSSNRPGTGSDDIYKLTFDKYIDYLLEVYILDAKSWKPILGAEVDFCNIKSSKTGADGMVSIRFKKNSVCDVKASAFGYKENHKNISIASPKQGIVIRDTIFLDLMVNEKIVLRNIYYDFDKWDILPESAAQLDQLVGLMKQNPEMKLELGSHTDERGSVPYNIKLSQRRAESAVSYIVSKGIDQSKIKAIGYGKSQLIYKSTPDHKCTPTEHRENRRTEIFIPGFLKGEHVKQVKGDYSNGKTDNIP